MLRIDALLNEAKPTPYMSIIDLKSGYHQMKVAKEDQDKMAFVCQFGSYKFTRMASGLRSALATFLRLMDEFRYGLHYLLALSYLDGIIVLSPTFQKDFSNLEQVFKHLSLFRLHGNREKCHLCCEKLKYLGHYITEDVTSVDLQKTAGITNMSSPKNFEQIQSYRKTYSWYRR